MNIHTAYELFFRFQDSETYLTCDDQVHQAKSIKKLYCHQNSGQKQLASDMKIEKKASKSGASAS